MHILSVRGPTHADYELSHVKVLVRRVQEDDVSVAVGLALYRVVAPRIGHPDLARKVCMRKDDPFRNLIEVDGLGVFLIIF